MKTMTRTALAAVAAACLFSPVAWGADATPATGAKMAQTEKAAPKHTRAPHEITRQQYLDQAGKRFDRMDANHDGKLTTVERRAYYKKMREEREKRHEHHMKKKAPEAGTSGTQQK